MKRAFLIILFTASTVFGEPQVAPNAPKDKPMPIKEGKASDVDRAISPYVAKARSSYPEAKKRYLAGLPPKHTLFITTRLRDKAGKWEQAFIAVESIKDGQVTGVIWSELKLVTGFKRGERYSFPEADMLDWLISKPDGTEEGNVVGIFLDTYRPDSEQTVREQLKDPEFKLYIVVFGIIVDADSKLQAFKVSKITDPKTGTTDAVDIRLPQPYIDAAKKKAIAKQYKPKLQDGKPVEFFTYFYYTPKRPVTIVTDLDQPLDKQP